jgi:2-oxoglutarate/2-oxoacid ferredoxin oxidoreductase subunit alpha
MTVDTPAKPIEDLESVVIRFVGDSGDGMQVTGAQFTDASAMVGNDLSTFPDFPAEIRAPAGTLYGVSGYQINFSSTHIYTPGDRLQALVAMNPAALKTNLADLESGGHLIVNADAFIDKNLKLANYETNPLEDGSLDEYHLISIPMTTLTREAVVSCELTTKEADRSKNMFALGAAYWLYDRQMQPTLDWVNQKWGKKLPNVAQANIMAIKQGYRYGDVSGLFPVKYRVAKAKLEPGTYRRIRGNDALALGLIAASQCADTQLFYGSYPITPASDILAALAKHKQFDVITYQAEDEIAAMCAVIGAAYGGLISVTGTSGPGMALKTEALGLGTILELPMVIVNVQRGGPSTGLPTKTEQSDLFQAVMGRNGECPIPVLATRSPADCFGMAIEAVRLAVKYMTPVILLTDGYLANGSEPWKIPNVADLPKIKVTYPEYKEGEDFLPYKRNEDLARPWGKAGIPGLAHRIGGLEKKNETGAYSTEPENHQLMVELRARKVAGMVKSIPDAEIMGEKKGKLLAISWGGTYGAVRTAIEHAHREDLSVSHVHLSYIHPFPANLGELIDGFEKILVPELNLGQLAYMLQASYLREATTLSKIQGKAFTATEIYEKIMEMVKE